MPEECVKEIKAKVCMPSHSLLISTESCGICKVIDCNQFSELLKLSRVTVYVKKFALNFKTVIQSAKPPTNWIVTAADIDQAELDWIIECQTSLTKEAKFESWKNQLQLFLDHQKVWRYGGRLTKADIPY